MGTYCKEKAAGFPAAFERMLYNSLVANLAVVVLVEEGADHIVDQLVLGVGHVHGKGRGEQDQRDERQLAQQLPQKNERFFQRIFLLSQ